MEKKNLKNLKQKCTTKKYSKHLVLMRERSSLEHTPITHINCESNQRKINNTRTHTIASLRNHH